MAKSSKTGGILFTLIFAGALGYGGWIYYKSKQPRDPVISTARVITSTIKQTVTATGDIVMRTQIDVGSLVSGKVIDVFKDFNDPVKKDDLLVLIDPITFQQKVDQATNSLKTATLNAANTKTDANRTLTLFAQNLATQKEKEQAEVQLVQADISVKNAELTLANAQTDLDRCSVRSPIDGFVMSRLIEPGKSVNASQSVANLFVIVSSYREMKIEALVSEADIGLVKADMPVEFTVDAFPSRTFNATVKQVRNAARNAGGVVSYPVLILVNNDEELLKPGMSANLAIIIANRPSVVSIPNGALRTRIPPDYKGEVRQGAGVTQAPASAAPGSDPAAGPTGQLPDGGMGRGAIAGGGRGGAGAGGGRGGAGGGRAGRGGGANLGNIGEGMNVATQDRTVYRLITEGDKKVIETIRVRTGIADTNNTELLQGSPLNQGDELVTFITIPTNTPILTSAPATGANAFGGATGGRGGGGAVGGGAAGGGGGRGGRG